MTLPHDGVQLPPCREVERREKEEKAPVFVLFCFVLLFSCFLTAPPNTLNFRKRKTLVAPEINISLDQSEGSLLSDDFLDTPDDLDINVDDIETPDETDSLEFLGNGNELEWEGELTSPAWSQSRLSAPTGFPSQLAGTMPPSSLAQVGQGS